MPRLRFLPISQSQADAYRAGAPDANGCAPERHIAGPDVHPCRCCLGRIPEGAPYLILAHRPFGTVQPYAESGPIFLCADRCEAYGENDAPPPLFLQTPRYLLRGYGADDRIVYGTGQTPASQDMAEAAESILARPDVAYVHVRSATNNCFQCRIESAEA